MPLAPPLLLKAFLTPVPPIPLMALLYADLHLHSKHSRAVSAQMDLEHLVEGARKKGLGLLGTGDFTHPLWFSELKAKLQPAQDGLFSLKGDASGVRFLLQTEISTIFSDKGTVKKAHHLLYAPSLETVAQLNDVLEKKGNLMADGRPTFGMSSAELVEVCRQVGKDLQVIPAHAWTPWFSVLGSKSGYDSIAEAYADQARHIHAFETGMSSDPAMNWRVSDLDKYAQISNSDSHSPYPYRIGRECNAFDFTEEKLSFDALFRAVQSMDSAHFKFTVEVDPNYGKYHFDGHRNCKFSCAPDVTQRLKGLCPVCRKPLTIGVLNRVEHLADRPAGFVPEGAIPFKTLLPLQELVAGSLNATLASKKVVAETERVFALYGTEFHALLEVPAEKLAADLSPKLANALLLNRAGKLHVKAGFDGEYGVLELESGKAELEKDVRQKGLEDFV